MSSVMDENYILGLNFISHDASASLVKNGKVVVAANEERFTRNKKDSSFPQNAVDYCLSYENICLDDINVVTFSFDPDTHHQDILEYINNHYPISEDLFKYRMGSIQKFENVEEKIREELNYRGEIYCCYHHKAHMASSFYPSDFAESAVISVDGLGDGVSTMIADASGNEFDVLKEIKFPNSLGIMYNAVTYYLGFNPSAGRGAGKVMGLSSYGDPSVYIDDFRNIVELTYNGEYSINFDYFEYPFQLDTWISDEFIQEFGPKRDENDEITECHENIAAALQKRLEEVYFHLAEWTKNETGQSNLCLAGGVALNSVANGKLQQAELFDNIYIPPPAGDDGTSLGSALYHHHNISNNTESQSITPFLGPEYSDQDVIDALEMYNLEYWRSSNVCKETADFIANGEIIGWFQGRMEIGPRALGNRSILADPRSEKSKEYVNKKVKFREPFRPFAPSILLEEVSEWFAHDAPAPYMIRVYDIKENKQSRIPSVTHADGTGRLQTVSAEDNQKYHQLISEFDELTGIPILLNTSFNIRGEPIVNSPIDAVQCFLGSGIDYLVMNEFVAEKDW
jgi:carbamoyltransferase